MAWRGFNVMVDKQRVLLLDCRPPSLFAASHIRGSICVALQGRTLISLAGPGPPTWSSNCWWDRHVLLITGPPSHKRKTPDHDALTFHPVFTFLQEEGLVRSLHLLEPDQGEEDAFTSFASSYPFLVTRSTKSVGIGSYPTEIIPRLLFLGDMSHAASQSRLKELQICHVVTIHTEPLKLPKSFVHAFFELEDAPFANIAQYFDPVYEFVERAKSAQKRVLIHCGAGASRSATLCAAYLMRAKHWGVEDALKFLKEHRSKVNPNPGFLSALHEYSCFLDENRLDVPTKASSAGIPWHLDILKKEDSIGSVLLDKDVISFGRGADCYMILDHTSISRQHAVLTRGENGEFKLVDNHSTHGTFVNGNVLSRGAAVVLKQGDILRFGASTRTESWVYLELLHALFGEDIGFR
ncbi:hypothetical protein GOP47_0018951 [Adiantum capillus-veneris]|uniref:protein-tyrosine-phosphatase n=1 Tax=Adiantum capillus-veneris TaxID=13818 RepID=A0A9D4UER8_ADICA|nr:hypothetical protein GOP47_0018951 [Adiantum capillus-veneris]